ncbi:cytochrome c, partial [Sinorhizobium sp. 6-117]|nr:cytochrome c [Sinorhizobium sp. 6-117]
MLVLGIGYYLLFVNQYVLAFENETEHFLHGSIGSEVATGPPYWVFKALPVMYKDRLGGEGYRRFGFLYQTPDADLPIGVSRRVVSGVERVWLNCSVCHVGTYRLPGKSERHMIPGAPSNNLRLQELITFLIDVGRDPGFNADALIAAINGDEVGGDLNVFERAIYRHVVFPRVKNAFLDLGRRLTFVSRQEPWGPGRVDTFNPYKAIQFNFPMGPENISGAALNGSSDYPAIWQQRPREGMNLHWDGNNDSVAERNLSAALGAGVTPLGNDTIIRRSVPNAAISVVDWGDRVELDDG